MVFLQTRDDDQNMLQHGGANGLELCDAQGLAGVYAEDLGAVRSAVRADFDVLPRYSSIP